MAYMKKLIALILSLTFVLALAGCGSSAINIVALPSTIKEVNISGYYDGSVINAGDFVVEDFDKFATWISQLSLKHRAFEEGETPSETIAGGNSYHFNINNGELTFTYADAGKELQYIVYGAEWYEVLNPTELPFKQK